MIYYIYLYHNILFQINNKIYSLILLLLISLLFNFYLYLMYHVFLEIYIKFHNRSYTDNSAPDISIQGQPFDFKNSKDISYLKNNIYLLEVKDIVPGMIVNISRVLVQQIKDPKLSKETQLYAKKVLQIVESKTLPVNNEQTAHSLFEIYSFIKKNPAPEGFRLSKIIPRDFTNKEIPETISSEDYLSLVKSVPLKEGSLNSPKALEAIMGILDKSTLSTQNKAFQSTFGVLGKDKIIDDVD